MKSFTSTSIVLEHLMHHTLILWNFCTFSSDLWEMASQSSFHFCFSLLQVESIFSYTREWYIFYFLCDLLLFKLIWSSLYSEYKFFHIYVCVYMYIRTLMQITCVNVNICMIYINKTNSMSHSVACLLCNWIIFFFWVADNFILNI